MAAPAAPPQQTPESLHRSLYVVDNIRLLERLNNETVDLIVTDPPFGKTATWKGELRPALTPDEQQHERDTLERWGVRTPASARRLGVELPQSAVEAQYKDIWAWEDVKEEWMVYLEGSHPKTHGVIETVSRVLDAGRPRNAASLAAYLAFMAVRLVEMHRILKPTGTLFLHCDYAANSYLRTLLDSIFGVNPGVSGDAENRFSEIIWERNSGRAKGSQHAARKPGVDTDTILRYTKSAEFTWHAPHRALTKDEMAAKFPLDDNDGRGPYNTSTPIFCAPSQGDRPNLCYTFQSPYGPVTNPHPSGWRVSQDVLADMNERGEIVWHPTKNPKRKAFASDYPGQPVGSLWTDIPNLGSQDKERTGYPTQKPVALAARIIAAGSNPGDLVLDPFAGCAYVPVAAELLDRKWLACDISPRAMTAIERQYSKPWERPLPGLNDEPEPLDFSQVSVLGPTELPLRTDSDPETKPPLPLMPRNYGEKLKMSSDEQKALMAEHSGWACWACGFAARTTTGGVIETTDHLHYDHISPKSFRATSDAFYNRALLCAACNILKGDRLVSMDAFRLEEPVVRRRESYGVTEAELIEPSQVHFEVTREYLRLYPNGDDA